MGFKPIAIYKKQNIGAITKRNRCNHKIKASVQSQKKIGVIAK